MSEFKDLFSTQATDYARFRPTYPAALYGFLAAQAPARELAWDVGTGNGQAAIELAKSFARVVATDPSEKQLSSAVPRPNVEYRVGPAEKSPLADQSADLITVAQAFHWFKQEEFFREVRRVAKPAAVLALWTYGLAAISPALDQVVFRLFEGKLGAYWEIERKLVDEGYRGVRLPFEEIAAPAFEMRAEWNLADLVGYLGTWSALQAYIRKNGENPIEEFYPELKAAWGAEARRPVNWRLGLRACRVPV